MANYKHYYTCEVCRISMTKALIKIVGTRILCEKCQTSMLVSK